MSFWGKTPRLAKVFWGGCVIATGYGLFVVQRNYFLPRCESEELMLGKTVVITGANDGIGKELTKTLAQKGARVVMGCRNMEQCEEIRQKFTEASYNKQITCKHLDLASLDSVRKFAKDINENEKRLDVLVNNAAIISKPEREITEDGFEKTFGVNYLSHFLLTNLLLDKMKESSTARSRARILNVTCYIHKGGKINFHDLNYMKDKFEFLECYSQSKLALVLFSNELAKRIKDTGVNIYIVNPGQTRTNIGKNTKMAQSRVFQFWTKPLRALFQKAVSEGIQTPLMCCIDPNLNEDSGKYYENCVEAEPKTYRNIEEDQVRLWAISERWTHLDQDFKSRKSK